MRRYRTRGGSVKVNWVLSEPPRHENISAHDAAQMGFMRPSPTLARYATPVEGLYLCGAGTHPGGGVMAACGHNAAHRILKDRGRGGLRRRVRSC